MKQSIATEDRQAQEVANVLTWRIEWFRHGGFNKRNARLLAESNIDYRYANKVMAACKAKGHDEAFVMNLLT